MPALQPDALLPEPKQDWPKQPKQRKSAQASAPVTHRVSLLSGPQLIYVAQLQPNVQHDKHAI